MVYTMRRPKSSFQTPHPRLYFQSLATLYPPPLAHIRPAFRCSRPASNKYKHAALFVLGCIRRSALQRRMYSPERDLGTRKKRPGSSFGPITRGHLVRVSGTTSRGDARTKCREKFYPTQGACRDIERTRNG
jgi:hypothetical protein